MQSNPPVEPMPAWENSRANERDGFLLFYGESGYPELGGEWNDFGSLATVLACLEVPVDVVEWCLRCGPRSSAQRVLRLMPGLQSST